MSIVMARQASRNEQATPTRWLITPHPADLSRVMHQRLLREYVPFASACLNSHNADLVAIQVIQTNVGSRIFHTTSVFLIRDMGVDSISGNTKLASGQGNVPVTVAQCLADFDTS